MTPEEERDYQEALRRIKEAEENKSVELDLCGLSNLTRFPPELADLASRGPHRRLLSRRVPVCGCAHLPTRRPERIGPLPPAFSTASFTPFKSATLRATSALFAPAAPSAKAIALPSPLLAPVIKFAHRSAPKFGARFAVWRSKPTEPGCACQTSAACARRSSSATNSSALTCVAARTTGGAHPASNASRHRVTHKHQRSPLSSPGKSNSATGVLRSLPAAALKRRNSSVITAHTVCKP
jgi:hypothetical protein